MINPMLFQQQQQQNNTGRNSYEKQFNRGFEDEKSEIIRKVMEPEFKSSEKVITYFDETKGAWVKGIIRSKHQEMNTRDLSTSQLEDDIKGDITMIQYKITILSLCETEDLYNIDMAPVIDFLTKNMQLRSTILKARGGKVLTGTLINEIRQVVDQTITDKSETRGGLSLFNPNPKQ
jgi:hypothetical protein